MNMIKILTFVTFSFSTLCAQKTTQFNVKIGGFTEGSTVKLLGSFVDQNYLADTAKLAADGSTSFSNAAGFKEGLYYLLLPDETNIQFLIASGENNFTIKTTKANLSLGLQAEGSVENTLFFDNLRFQSALEAKFNALNQQLRTAAPQTPQYQDLKNKQQALLDERDARLADIKRQYPNALYTKFKIAGQNPKIRFSFRPDGSLDSTLTMFNFQRDWWNDYDFTDLRLTRTPVFFNKMKKFIQDYTVQRPDSLVSAADFLIDKTLVNKELFNITASWIAAQYKPGQTKLMDGEAVYSHLILKYFTPDRVTDITPADLEATRKKAQDMRLSLLGLTGQNVWGKDKNGVKRSLYDLTSDFKIVYIYNPDCEHCQAETPKLRAFYDKWKSRGVEIFSIVTNPKDRAEWLNFQQKYGVNWTDVYDPALESKFHEKYYIDITPELYLLDKDFRIIAKNLKPDQLPEMLEIQMKGK